MAAQPLAPASQPANTDRVAFNLALVRYADATAARGALPYYASLATELSACDAVDTAKAQLAAAPTPDLAAFATKLRVLLAEAGTPPLIVASLTADLRRMGRAAGVVRQAH